MKAAVIVLGMHRSGTSSVAGTLAHLGAAAPLTLMPEHPDNPKGYWESAPLVELNDRILESASSDWSDWRLLNTEWFASNAAQPYRDELIALISTEFGAQPLIVLKDPRICRLFPIWEDALRALGYSIVVMMPLRAPSEIAASLQKRDGFSPERSLLIWLRNVLEAERFTRRIPRHLFQWADFIEDWRTQVEAMAKTSGIELTLSSESAMRAVDTFLDSGMRRNICADRLPSAALSWASQADQILLAMVERPDDPSLHQQLDDIHHLFNDTSRIYAPAFSGLERELANLSNSSSITIQRAITERNIALHDKQWLLDELEKRTRAFESQIAEISSDRSSVIDHESVKALSDESSPLATEAIAIAEDSSTEDMGTAQARRIHDLEAQLEQAIHAHQVEIGCLTDEAESSIQRLGVAETAHETELTRYRKTEASSASRIVSLENEVSIITQAADHLRAELHALKENYAIATRKLVDLNQTFDRAAAATLIEQGRLESGLADCSERLAMANQSREQSEQALSAALAKHIEAEASSNEKIQALEDEVTALTLAASLASIETEERIKALTSDLFQTNEKLEVVKEAQKMLLEAIRLHPVKTALRSMMGRMKDLPDD